MSLGSPVTLGNDSSSNRHLYRKTSGLLLHFTIISWTFFNLFSFSMGLSRPLFFLGPLQSRAMCPFLSQFLFFVLCYSCSELGFELGFLKTVESVLKYIFLPFFKLKINRICSKISRNHTILPIFSSHPFYTKVYPSFLDSVEWRRKGTVACG